MAITPKAKMKEAARMRGFEITQKRIVSRVEDGGDMHPFEAAMKSIGHDMMENDMGGEYEFTVPWEFLGSNPGYPTEYPNVDGIHFTITVEHDA